MRHALILFVDDGASSDGGGAGVRLRETTNGG